ncbi:vWA domain-containing protein [Actinokineospora enzanensis]|uniref:vWA domain-containing protein n=1 Tax=Actinokineospora enzanensis TaxID=155975 RepID=UPI00036D0231|nr:hypothetical protein [Actinokineospora enzanensis]
MRTEILPCYVVCDVSSSTTDHLDELNAGLREFRDSGTDTDVLVRVCIVSFAGAPRLLHPLRPLAELPEVAAPQPKVGSNFGPVFAFLRDTIDRDMRVIEAGRSPVRRPVVFFASDGRPTDPTTWHTAYDALVDPGWQASPSVVAFGIGAADHLVLCRIGTSGVFLGRDGVRMGTALRVSMTSSASPRHG